VAGGGIFPLPARRTTAHLRLSAPLVSRAAPRDKARLDPEPMEPPMPWTALITLDGGHARLEPLSQRHCAALAEAVKDGESWRLWYTAVPSPDGMQAEIDRRLSLREAARWRRSR
jgi:hypothetical protein